MPAITDLYTDAEFESLLPEASENELAELTQSIIDEGFREPILYWSNPTDNQQTIIDGHRRQDIYNKLRKGSDLNGAIPSIKGMKFDDRDAVICWIVRNQIARRNLKSVDRSRLVKVLYKQVQKDAEHQSDARTQTPTRTGKASEEVAQQVGLSSATVERDLSWEKALEALGRVNAKFEADVRKGTLKVPKQDIISAGKLKDLGKAIGHMRAGKRPDGSDRKGKPTASTTARQSARPATRHQIFKPLLDAIGHAGKALTKVEKATGDKKPKIKDYLSKAIDLAVAWKEAK